ncbi:MAG: RNA-binding protein [Bacteroidia bacterium]|nr:RNA-binding protein [Bacteroidia bacterium]
MNIFVAKLNFRTTSESLNSLFEQFGEVSSANVITDRDTGKSKGFGFVEMPDDQEAQEAIDNLNDTEFEGRIIAVSKARPREESPRRDNNRFGGGGGGGGRFNRY